MGAVYLALDSTLKRNVALKLLPRDKAENTTLVRRFKAEAQAAAHLKHDNIVAIYDAGEADGYFYIALEYVDGTDAANLVSKRGCLPVKRSIEVIRQVALALKHASELRIVHRDIKPGNLLIRRDGEVKLADLGLARLDDETADTSITRTGTTVGTVDYMSPEQARNSRSADVRSDIYSLGCTWYYLLTGGPPFPDGSVTNKLKAHFDTPFPDPRAKNPQVPEAVSAVMRRMTEKDPAKRYQSAQELLTDLEEVRQGGTRVSDAILSDIEDSASSTDSPAFAPAARRKKRSAGSDSGEKSVSTSRSGRPRHRKSVVDLPGGRGQALLPEHAEGGSDLGRAVGFYGLVALAAIALIFGCIWLIQQMNTAVDSGDGDLAGHLAETGKKGGGQEKASRQIVGSSQPGGEPGGQGAESGSRRVGSDSAVDPATPNSGKSVEPGQPVIRLGGGSDGEAAAAGGVRPDRKLTTRDREESAHLPAWVQELADARPPKTTVVVDPRGGGKGVTTLNEAIRQLGDEGARIVLTGPGPFPLRADVIRNAGRVVIEPADAQAERPLVILLPPEQGSVDAFLACENTTLDLRRVHFAADVTDFTTTPGTALIHVQGGNLSVQGCSLTARGVPRTGMTALRVSASDPVGSNGVASPARVLLADSVIRGQMLTSILLEPVQVDLVVRNSLLWGGENSAIRLTSAAVAGSARRKVAFLSATVCSQAAALDYEAGPQGSPAAEIVVENSLVATPEGADSGVLLRLTGLDETQARTLIGKELRWKSTNSLYAGWKWLARVGDDGPALATSVTQWQLLWQETDSTEKNFPRRHWPAQEVADVNSVPLEQFDRRSYGKSEVTVSGGGVPGCSTSELRVASLGAMDVIETISRRPAVPEGMFGGGGVVETVQVDLTKEDLGKVITARRLQTGMIIVARGSGVCTSSPLEIRGVWVRLRFEQSPGAPLVLMPRQASAGKDVDALISVSGGGLDLQGGVLLTTGMGSKVPAPAWLISAEDSDLAVSNCRLQGALGSSQGRTRGLIEWRQTVPGSPSRPFAGSRPGYAVIKDSYLSGSGTLISAQLGSRALIVRNSIMLSRSDMFSLTLAGTEGGLGGAVDLTQSTFSAAGTYFKVTPEDRADVTVKPTEFFTDRCVFGPASRSGASVPQTTLMTISGKDLGAGQLTWWENQTGYAADVSCFLRSDDAEATSQDYQADWKRRWGAENCLSPLLGARGVLLMQELPVKNDELARLEPAGFQLHPNSGAATWDGGGPIGVRLELLSIPSATSVVSPAGKGRGPRPAGGKPGPQQGF